MAAVVFCMSAFLFFFFPERIEKSAQRWAEARAIGIGLVLANAVKPGLEFDEAASVNDLLKGLADAKSALYGAVLRGDGSVLAAFNPEHVPSPLKANPASGYATVVENAELHIVAAVEAEAGTRGTLAIGFSLAELEREKLDIRLLTLLFSIVVLALGLVLALTIGTVMVRPIAALTQIAGDIVAQGDLTQPINVTSNDEAGLLAESFRQMVERLRSILLALKRQVDGMSTAIEQISKVSTSVSVGADTVQSLVQDTSGSVQQMQASITGVAKSVDVLQHSAEQGSASILEMAPTNDEVAANVQSMAASVQQTATAIESMASSVKGIAKNIESLNDTISGTSASMTEIDTSIGEVEKNATQTANLSETASSNAEGGVEALRKTLDGIERIRDSSSTASQVIEKLEKSISTIGNIVNVIDDVAEQTNLLALNAAIIAAQAGEQGRGFSVVADEIKNLAERTSSSTTEIASLINTVQDESRKAVLAMGRGVDSVEQGVRLGHAAAEALEKILSSSRDATVMMQAIARATVQQARATKQVTSAIQRIAATVQDISNTSREQAKGSEQIMDSTATMKELTLQVRSSGQEQARGSKQVIQSIESVTEMVSQVDSAQGQQKDAAKVVLRAIESIQRVSEHQNDSVRQLESAIESMQAQADDLQAELQQFRV
jgi:methyl-accepting chemotaxis protein